MHPTRIYCILYAREMTMTFGELVRLLGKNGFKIVIQNEKQAAD